MAAVVVLLAIGAGAFFFVRSGQDDDATGGRDDAAAATTVPISSTLPGGARLEAGGPGAAFQAFAGAVADSDWDRACAVLSTSTLDEIFKRGQDCNYVLENAGDATPFPKDATVIVLGEKPDGDRAEVSFQIDDEVATKPAVLVKQDGEWKVDLFAKATGIGNTAGAQTSACQIEQRTVETAIEAYNATTGGYPPDAEALVGGYLQEIPANTEVNPDGTVTMINDCA